MATQRKGTMSFEELNTLNTRLENIAKLCKLYEESAKVYLASEQDITYLTNAESGGLNTEFVKFSEQSVVAYGVKDANATTNASVEFDLQENYEDWNSIGIVFYIDPIAYSNTLNQQSSLFIQIALNTVAAETIEPLTYKAGWNIVKLLPSDFTFTEKPTLEKITVRLLAPDTDYSIGDIFGNVYIDSFHVDMKAKPTIMLNFDGLYQPTVDNGGYDYLKGKGLPFTVFSNDFSSLSTTLLDKAKELKTLANEMGVYGFANFSTWAEVTDATYNSPLLPVDESKISYIETFGDLPFSYSCRLGQLSSVGESALRDYGYNIIRPNVEGRTSWFDYSMSSTTTKEFNDPTLQDLTDFIDELIETGGIYSMFTHGIGDDDDDFFGPSFLSFIRITIWEQFIDYIKLLVDSGALDVLTFKGFYDNAIGTVKI